MRFVVPTDLLAAELRPRLDALARRLAEADTNAGALTIVSERAAPTLGIKPSSVFKRLGDILAERTTATGAGLADALLLSLGVMIEDTGLPTLPNTKGGACEMAETWYGAESSSERADGEMTSEALAELAERLLAFARGFLSNVDELALAA